MIVCTNKIDNSVCFIIHKPEDIDNYLFIESEMELHEMPMLEGRFTTEDYLDLKVKEGKWVPFGSQST